VSRWALVALVLCLPRPVYGQSETALHVAIGGYMVTAGSDLAVTTYGLGAGQVREANPILRPFEHKPVAMAAVKMGVGAAVSSLLLHTHQRSRKRAFWTAVCLTALNSYITYRNAKLLPKR
jgi:hypothetical protein